MQPGSELVADPPVGRAQHQDPIPSPVTAEADRSDRSTTESARPPIPAKISRRSPRRTDPVAHGPPGHGTPGPTRWSASAPAPHALVVHRAQRLTALNFSLRPATTWLTHARGPPMGSRVCALPARSVLISVPVSHPTDLGRIAQGSTTGGVAARLPHRHVATNPPTGRASPGHGASGRRPETAWPGRCRWPPGVMTLHAMGELRRRATGVARGDGRVVGSGRGRPDGDRESP